MKGNDDVVGSATDIIKIITEGKIPNDLDELRVKEIRTTIKKIFEVQKLKKKGVSHEKLTSFLLEKLGHSNEDFEKGLALYNFIIDNKKFLKEIIENDKNNTIKFRQSGHLIDQTLKYTDPKKKDAQLTFFDIISPETKNKIENSKIEVKAEGIRLSASEDKLLKAINKLLFEKSENTNEEAEDFYTGNAHIENQLIPYGGNGKHARAAVLKIIPAELYKAYLDHENYSGDDIKFIKKLLNDLANKKFLITYDRIRKANGKTVTDRIEDFQPLVKIMNFMEGLTESDLKKLNSGDAQIRKQKGELILALNPIFIDQISTKYVEFPSDINKRTTVAAGGHKLLTDSMIILRDYMLREISSKRFEVQINEEKFPYLLRLDSYIQKRKKSIIAKRIQDAISCVKQLGIILDYEIIAGAKGQQKYCFKLNKNFE